PNPYARYGWIEQGQVDTITTDVYTSTNFLGFIPTGHNHADSSTPAARQQPAITTPGGRYFCAVQSTACDYTGTPDAAYTFDQNVFAEFGPNVTVYKDSWCTYSWGSL